MAKTTVIKNTKHIPDDEELTPEQAEWRAKNDPKHRLNFNQIVFRIASEKHSAAEEAKREAAEEAKRKATLKGMAEDVHAADGKNKVSIEQFIALARDVSDRADLDDLVKVLHANLIISSQNMDLRPQDFIASIRMLRELQQNDTEAEVVDPYAIDTLSEEETCRILVESITAQFHVWRQREDTENIRAALWLVTFIDEFLRMIFLGKPYGGIVEEVAKNVERAYYPD
jgi:hypothetical protein